MGGSVRKPVSIGAAGNLAVAVACRRNEDDFVQVGVSGRGLETSLVRYSGDLREQWRQHELGISVQVATPHLDDALGNGRTNGHDPAPPVPRVFDAFFWN